MRYRFLAHSSLAIGFIFILLWGNPLPQPATAAAHPPLADCPTAPPDEPHPVLTTHHSVLIPQYSPLTIAIYAPEEAHYTYVTGQAAPHTAVTLRIWRAGQLLVTQEATSGGDGRYTLAPAWQPSCTATGYAWQLASGDVVDITAGADTATTTVAPLSATLDPTTNRALGQTSAERTLAITLTATPIPCQTTT